jgi:SnoaL-like domain
MRIKAAIAGFSVCPGHSKAVLPVAQLATEVFVFVPHRVCVRGLSKPTKRLFRRGALHRRRNPPGVAKLVADPAYAVPLDGAMVSIVTSATDAATPADAQFIHDEWDRRTRAHDIEGLVDLYLPDATLESPLVPRILDQDSGVLRGHDELRRFFVKGTAGRPNELVRWYRTGRFMFDGRTLIWEYPRQTPDDEQVDLVEVMELNGPHIAHHRIYWGWYGAPLLERPR